MDKSEIEDYINKLMKIEKSLNSDDESFDIAYIQQLDSLLKKLQSDVSISNDSSVKENSFKLNVKIKKIHPNAIIPSYAKDGDAGLDLTATEIISETPFQISYGTGISLEIPKGYVGLVFPRSSIRKYDLALTNCVGVIDSGYRGEIQATFKKTNWLKGNNSEKYQIGDRIAQIMIIPYPNIYFIEVDSLTDTDRGQGGFGSTGS